MHHIVHGWRSKQCNVDILLPHHIPKAGYIPPARSWSGSHISWTHRQFINRWSDTQTNLTDFFNTKELRFYWGLFSSGGTQTPSKGNVPFLPIICFFFFCHYPEFMTIAEGWNLNWQIGSFTFRLSAIFIKKVQYSTICLSISYSILPSVMNKTPRYLNALTWDSHLLPTQRGHYIIFRVPWPQAWRCWLSSHALHIGLQTTLEVTAQWSQQDYIICKQKGWNEFTKMVDTLHFPATP